MIRRPGLSSARDRHVVFDRLSARRGAILLAASLLCGGCTAQLNTAPSGATAPALIPAPASVATRPGQFTVRDGMAVAVPSGDAEARKAADQFVDMLRQTRGLDLKVREGTEGDIRLRRVAGGTGEAYSLAASPDGVTISATDASGLLYGTVTLWQLLTQAPGRSDTVTIDAVMIEDAPRFGWRGLMLDSVRHFQSPAFIKQLIDWMALHKLNMLHWHLTDDQGWRLEIRKYPRLTEVGAWRVPAGAGAAADIDPATGKPRLYGGYYTQDQVRDIVAYAQARNITIVPEIDVPGHALAAIVAYPKLGVLDNPPKAVMSDWGVYPYLYNVEEPTFGFLEDVLTEVLALFPGTYVHIGGDEAVKDQWKASPRVQERMRALGIKDEHALQSYVVQRLERFLNARGRRLIGWDEILEGGLAPNATVMSWRGIDGAVAAAQAGHDAILSPNPTLYFDHRQSGSSDEPPGRGRIVSLADVYAFDPLPDRLTPEQQRHILGVQANLWTEHVRTEARVEHMIFPRAAAVAELGWSPAAAHDWRSFAKRLVPQIDRYTALGIDYAGSAVAIRPDIEFDQATNKLTVSLSNEIGSDDIRYTLDGSVPSANSPRYREPLVLNLPTRLRAAAFVEGRAIPSALDRRYDAGSVRRRMSQDLKTCAGKLVLSLEDDAPLAGSRAVFLTDIMNPCWVWEQAPLAGVAEIEVGVGQVPFNFQIGKDIESIRFRSPATPESELEVRAGGCNGEPVAVLPLAPAKGNPAVTRLRGAIAAHQDMSDLCFTFTQHGVDPMWTIDWVQLVPKVSH